MKTLEEIIKQEKKQRHESGEYGIKACKESIEIALRLNNTLGGSKDLFDILRDTVKKTNEDSFYNSAMVLACWELINGK